MASGNPAPNKAAGGASVGKTAGDGQNDPAAAALKTTIKTAIGELNQMPSCVRPEDKYDGYVSDVPYGYNAAYGSQRLYYTQPRHD
jgi:hypothetical protein